MEKFDLLLKVLSDLHKADVLKHCTLVGSWCLEFYRMLYNNPPEIPAVRTMDADILLPPHISVRHPIDLTAILEQNGFITDIEYPSGLLKFRHAMLDIEFLTDPGSKAEESIRTFKELHVNAQELRYMSIALKYQKAVEYNGLTVNIPESEAFALHKLIVCMERKNKEKAIKDVETVKGLFLFFTGKPTHCARLKEIYDNMPKGWRSRIDKAMTAHSVDFPQ